MENPENQQVLTSGNNTEAPTARELVKLLPSLYYAVNRVLEDSAPAFSKKVGVVLLALENSPQADDAGKYLTTGDIAKLFRESFVATESSVKSETSKVKNDLFALNFVKIEGGKDHIHLSAKGEEAMSQLLKTASGILRDALSMLDADEQRQLSGFAARMMLATTRKFAKGESQSSSEQESVA